MESNGFQADHIPGYSRTFDILLRTSYREVSRYTYRAIAHWRAASVNTEDLVQEAYARLFEKLIQDPGLAQQFANKETLVRYLQRIVDYCILELARRDKAETTNVSLQGYIPEKGQDDTDPVDTAMDTSELISQKEWLLASLQKLQPRARDVLLLSVQGHSAQEIARHLTMTAGAVRVELSRTKSILRSWLREEERASSLSPSPTQVLSWVDFPWDPAISPAPLSMSQRAVLRMRLAEQKSFREIARELQKSVSAVRCQYYRARRSPTIVQERGWTKARLRQLPVKLGETVQLHFIDGLSYSTIARKLGLAESTIRARISRARRIDRLGQTRNHVRQSSGPIRSKHRLPSEQHYEQLRWIPSRFRSVMEDFYDKENPLSIKEIASGCGRTKHITSEGTIKTYLRRGRQFLEERCS